MALTINQYNFNQLNNRSKGDRFFVDKGGRLKTMGIFDNLRYDLDKTFRRAVQEAVKGVVQTVVRGVSNKQLECTSVERFIFQKIFPLNHKIVDADVLQQMSNEGGAVQCAIAKKAAEVHLGLNTNRTVYSFDQKIRGIEQEIASLEAQIPPISETPGASEVQKEMDSILRNPRISEFKRVGVQESLEFAAFVRIYEEGKDPKDIRIKANELVKVFEKIRILKWRKQQLEDYRNKFFRALIGLKMNLSHRTNIHNSGWSGAYFWRDYQTGKIIGVYKPSDEDSFSSGSPKLYARFRYHGRRVISAFFNMLGIDLHIFNKYQVGKAHAAEAATCKIAGVIHEICMNNHALAQMTKTPIVPGTEVIHVDEPSTHTKRGTGSFQLFLDNPTDLTNFLQIDKSYHTLLNETPGDFKKRLMTLPILAQYQLILVLHFLVGAQDPHAENILVVRDSEGKEELKAIDNGMGLSWTYPNRKEALKMRIMEDCRLPLAEEPMLPQIQQLIEALGEKLPQLRTRIHENYGPLEPAEVTDGRYDQIVRRYEVLKKVAKEGTPLSQLEHLVFEGPQTAFLASSNALPWANLTTPARFTDRTSAQY